MWTVYKHTSPSNKVYIGITSKSCQERWANGNGYKGNSIFSKSIKKYGWKNISHEILYEGLTKKEAIKKEKERLAAMEPVKIKKIIVPMKPKERKIELLDINDYLED